MSRIQQGTNLPVEDTGVERMVYDSRHHDPHDRTSEPFDVVAD